MTRASGRIPSLSLGVQPRSSLLVLHGADGGAKSVQRSTSPYVLAGAALSLSDPREPFDLDPRVFIQPKMIDRQRKIVGRCLKVTDADGLRIQHLPALRRIWPGAAPPWKQLSQETISIRLAGIDAPEMAHFGKEAQGECVSYILSMPISSGATTLNPMSFFVLCVCVAAHSQEAFDYLKEIALHRKVKLQLLRKDRTLGGICYRYCCALRLC